MHGTLYLAVTQDYKTFFDTNYSEFPQAEKIVDAGWGIYSLIGFAGAFALVFSIGLAVVAIFLGNSKERSEAKTKVLNTCLWGALFFGVSGILTMIYQYFNGINI